MVDMDTLAERLLSARTEKNATQDDLAKLVGRSKQAISKIESGGTLEPATSTLEPIARFLGVNLRWLSTGMGPRYISEGIADAGWADVLGVKQAASLGDGAEPDEYAETHKLKFRADSLRRKHLRPDKLAVIYGKGDSMWPTIKDGDAILVDLADKEPRDEKLFVITYGRDLFAKRLVKLGDRWFIDSDNKSDPKWKRPIPVEEAKGFEIHGRVRWIGSWED